MKNIKIVLAALLVISGLQAFPQLKKANRQFELFRYAQAIPLYRKAVESKNESTSREAIVRLADCYRFVNNAAEARSWYQRATEQSNTEPINFFYLGQAERTLQEYAKARESFLKYASLAPADSRGKLYADYCALMDEWAKFPPSAEIKNAKRLNSEYTDFGPAFYDNGLVYTSDRNPSLLENNRYGWTNFNYLNLYQSKPKYYKDFWDDMQNPASMSDKFNQTFHDGPAFFSENDSKIYLTRTRVEKVKKGKGSILTFMLKIYYADLNNGNVDYSEFPFNSNSYSVGHPTVSSNGKTMILVSDMPGGSGGSDLYQSQFSEGAWNSPVSLGPIINSTGNETFPSLVNDSLLYFASDGHPGYGGLDMFVSKLVNGKWSTPVNLRAPLNSSYDDFSIAISTDLATGFFSSNRPGGQGSDDIYAFRNAGQLLNKDVIFSGDLLADKLEVSGLVKDKNSRLPLGGARVFVLNTKTNKVKALETDPDGTFTTPAERGVLYITKAVMPDYLTDCLNFRIELADTASKQHIPRDLLLDKLEIDKIYQIENIYYDLDKWYIREDAKPPLDNLVAILKQYPITIELSSHTDSRASQDYNDELSQKRAESAVRYIVLQGIDPARLVAKGYGENQLVNKCSDDVVCSETDHQANRRTEFRILSIEKPDVEKEFDPSVFKTGEEVDVYLFDPAFFNKCFGSNEVSENIKVPVKHQETAAMVTPPLEQLSRNTENETCFGVQLLASVTEIALDSPELKGVTDVKSYVSGKWFKYITGCVTSYDDAVQLRKEMVDRGHVNAFVIKIENGKVASMH